MRTYHWLLATIILLSPKTFAQQTDQPNIIFILTDDQGYADAGCYGSADIRTPNIDRLAETGIRFSQMYANAPICSPSRAALLTGKTPHHAGVPRNAGGKNGMPTSEITIAEVLKENGYATANIGKWHLGNSAALQPNQQGFDYQFGHFVGCIDNYSHFYFWNGPNRHDLYRNGQEIFEDGAYFPALCYEEAAAFIDKNHDNPFFVYYAMNTPHYPYQGSAEWLSYYNEQEIPYPRNLYAAFVSTFDTYIGKLIDKIDKMGLREKTIIVFQSDHGHSTEERAHFGGGSAGIYRGAKGSLFEGGLRVPSIISWPGHLDQNTVRDQWVIASDWFPTLLDLANISLPLHSIDGTSIRPILDDEQANAVHERWHWRFGKHWSVRQGPWKLLYDPLDTSEKRRPAANQPEDIYYLVNLVIDPAELKNVAAQYPDRVHELKAIYQELSSLDNSASNKR
ncbi:MAG: sulfatase-like hydrolase/transferase [Saprospiraceae bacterium]|nr:sulfatase-like hydrolase/transferase [Saprospiraceae bacterium]